MGSTFSRRRLAAFSLIELLIVIAIIGTLIGMLVPAVQKVRETAARTECQNNLRQLGLACLSYESVVGRFPPQAVTTPYQHSWVGLILPYLEQESITKNYIRDTANWYDPVNLSARSAFVPVFYCPLANSDRIGSSAFPVNGVLQGPFAGAAWDYTNVWGITKKLGLLLGGYSDPGARLGVITDGGSRIVQIYDGTSNTILASECANRPEYWVKGFRVTGLAPPSGSGGPGIVTGGLWADHQTGGLAIDGASMDGLSLVGPCAINCTNDYEIYSNHPRGANAVFVDGSVRFLHASMPIRTLAALATRAGSEVVVEDY